ncbi:DNA helicase PcrA [Candidatus Poribacteria bacterium]|nr:DNA helicase PcrA [Candidatus Poribacteria bacterium]MYA58043.1 DNA helicase PcrA [Candidatus Poribacteria bacterium]
MTDNLLSSLNEVQREAVQHTEGPLLILSGAGSGKTRVITHRIAYLLEHHDVSPYRILAVTFTNKAAKEMKDRLDVLVKGSVSRDLWVATFHATCARILRRDIEKLGKNAETESVSRSRDHAYTRDFTIFDTGEQATLVKDVLRQLNYSDKQYNPRAILSHISRVKNESISPEAYRHIADGYFERIVSEVYVLYQDALRLNNSLDFDDLLLFTVRLLNENSEVCQFYQNKFEYILVDEYQDTNRCQYELVNLLTGTKQNICVVGDDDQSIYAFRGADIRNILDFEKDYPNTRVLRLEQNYRSTQNILDAAWGVVHNNKARKAKRLWTDNDMGEPITCYEAMDENDEAGYVGTQIEDWHAEGVDYKDFAVFYRTNAQSRIFEEAFRAADIPYQIVGGVGFYDRMEIKDLLAYLRVVCNPNDSVSVRRIINVPSRGIGATTLDRLMNFAARQGISLFAAIQRVDEITAINRGLQTKVQRFAKIFDDFDAAMLPADALDHVLKVTGYLKNLKAQRTIEAQNRVENIEELINAVIEYEQSTPEPTLSDYLENVALTADIDAMETDTTDMVTLMTLHSAKGLEFPFVFIVGMEEGYLPHKRSIDEAMEAAIEEERRLCYVGITRAMEQLYLSHASERRMFRETLYPSPSRFISEIPEHLVKHVDRYRSPFRQSGSLDEVVSEDVVDYQVDQIVLHPQFGRGKITKISRSGHGVYVTVRFSRGGTTRRLDPSLTPLTISDY